MLKKVLIVALINVSCCLSSIAQIYNMKTNGLSDIPVKSKDSADYIREISSPDNTDLTLFIVKDFYKNGNPKMTGKTSNFEPSKIQLEGPILEFFENGGKKAEKNYVHNVAVGNVTEYFPDGKLYLTGKYDEKIKQLDDNGNPVGNENKLIVDECRDSTGKILVKGGEGHYIKYDSDFKNVWEEGAVSGGLEVGEWHGRFSKGVGGLKDTVKYVCTYNGGLVKNGISYDSRGHKYPFPYAWEEPKFKGGLEALYKYLSGNIHYPVDAKKNNIQGKVFLSFVVDNDGSITNVRVVRGIGSGCDEEALRVIKSSPKWVPGKIYGIPVRVQYAVPISFSLQRVDD